MTKELYAVNTSVVAPVKTLEVVHESEDMYLLENKVLLTKKYMGDSHHLYFTDKALAETVASYVKMSCYAKPQLTNMQAIRNCENPTSLAIVLSNMIQTLCEDGMPTHDCIEEWLNSPSQEEEQKDDVDTYGLEEYDSLKDGDTVFYLDEKKNILRGQIFGVRRNKEQRITYVSVEAPDDFLGIAGDQLGKTLFIRKHVAAFFAQK